MGCHGRGFRAIFLTDSTQETLDFPEGSIRLITDMTNTAPTTTFPEGLYDKELEAYDTALNYCSRATEDPIEHNRAVDRLLKTALSIALARGDDVGTFNDLISQVTRKN